MPISLLRRLVLALFGALLVLGVASSAQAATAETRVRGLDATIALCTQLAESSQPTNHRANYDEPVANVADSCVAAEAGTVLVDSNAVAGLAKDPSLAGRLGAGERAAVSYVSGPELRNAAARSNGKFFVPKALKGLPVLGDRPSIDLIINLRGQMGRALGKVGDGIIGAQAIEKGIPLVTNDTELAKIVLSFGGVVR